MSQMTAISQVHTHNSITRSQQGKEHCHIGLSTRMRLYIGIACTKKLLGSINSQLLYHIYVFAATIVTLTWIALCIFIGEDTALSSHNSLADNILGSNQLQLVSLTIQLLVNCLGNLWIYSVQIIHQCHTNTS